MTLKELKNKLDKLEKAYGDEIEILIFTKEDNKGRAFHSPNAIEVRAAIDDKGNTIEHIYILRK